MYRTLALVPLLLAVLAVPEPGHAQISITGGPLFTTISGDDARGPFGEDFGDTADLDTRDGYFVGASVRIPLVSIVSINPGLYYAEKGTRFERDGGFQDGYLQLSYVEIPMTVSAAVWGADGPASVSLVAGPRVSFEVECVLEGFGFSLGNSYGQFDSCLQGGATDAPPVDDAVRESTLWGLILGAEVSLGGFLLTGGWDIGLTSLDASGAGQDFTNSGWFLGFGIRIDL